MRFVLLLACAGSLFGEFRAGAFKTVITPTVKEGHPVYMAGFGHNRVAKTVHDDLYARCLGVLFPPIDEDYGYITLEAMLARKPVITCTDSGGPLEFAIHHRTGIIADPTPAALAAAMDSLWEDCERARQWGDAGRQRYDDLKIDWKNVVEKLLQ